MPEIAKQYKHRVGVRAEICFDIESDTETLTRDELRAKILAVIGAAEDEDEGYDLPEPLVAGRAYFAWQSVTGESRDPGGSESFEIYDTWEADREEL